MQMPAHVADRYTYTGWTKKVWRFSALISSELVKDTKMKLRQHKQNVLTNYKTSVQCINIKCAQIVSIFHKKHERFRFFALGAITGTSEALLRRPDHDQSRSAQTVRGTINGSPRLPTWTEKRTTVVSMGSVIAITIDRDQGGLEVSMKTGSVDYSILQFSCSNLVAV